MPFFLRIPLPVMSCLPCLPVKLVIHNFASTRKLSLRELPILSFVLLNVLYCFRTYFFYMSVFPARWGSCYSVTKSCLTLRLHGLVRARFPYPLLSPGIFSDSCPLSWWCHPTVSFSVTPFSCPQSFPASRSFSVNQLFASSGQSIGASASSSILPMNIQGWFPLGFTALIILLSRGLSRVFFNITVQKHQFFYSQPSLCSNSHIHTWLLEKP